MAGGLGRRDAILGEQEVDDFCGRFGAEFRRDGDEDVGAAGKVGGEVEGGGGGEGDRAGGGVRPGRVAGPWSPPAPVRPQSSGSRVSWRSAAGAAASAAGARGRRSNAQRARISASAAGASGKAAKVMAAALAAAETGSPARLCSAGFPRGASAVGDGKVEAAAAAASRPGVETGRAAGEVAPQLKQLAPAEARRSPREAQIAQRRCVGVEAQDFGGGRGALKRQARAQRPGGGRVAAQMRVEEREAGAGGRTADRPPLPFRLPAPRSEPPAAAERCGFPGLSANWPWFGLA